MAFPEIERSEEEAELLKQLDEAIAHQDKARIIEVIFKTITMEPRCSFRRLIYQRLGMDYRDYCPLYLAGGMEITNALCDAEEL